VHAGLLSLFKENRILQYGYIQDIGENTCPPDSKMKIIDLWDVIPYRS
jgi:hypothetical protein